MSHIKKIEKHLSPLQAKMLAAMPVGREVSSSDLIYLVYGVNPPYNVRGTLLSTMSVLTSKLDHLDIGWKIAKGPRKGPRPMTYKLTVEKGR
jgi:hypothetical protein